MILKSHIFDDELPVENQGSFSVCPSVVLSLPSIPPSVFPSPSRVWNNLQTTSSIQSTLGNLKFKCFVFNLMESSIF